jgi:predicted ATPase/DNA-binding CsgD family transcriptional regulator
LIGTSRLVTLTGPGGTGKTRLAIEVAAALPDPPGGPFRFVDLSPISDLTLVPSAIADALGIREQADETPFETVARTIGARPFAIVLDNLEQLTGVGALLGDLLSRCPNLRLLATSRVSLHVRGEHVFPVEPLPIPLPDEEASLPRLMSSPSIALFVDRAQAIDPKFALTSENAAVVAEICRRLDGLPLAIELAATRIRMFSPSALLARLSRRLPLLSGGPADAPLRQQTLRDTIAWSVDLLESGEREVFEAFAVFTGGFNASAAEAVVPAFRKRGGLDLQATLDSLVDRNLLWVRPGSDGEPRLGMLETIREFAWDQLSEAHRALLRDRHLAHFMSFVEETHSASRGASQGTAIRDVLMERANIRAALVHARATDRQALVRLVAALPRRFWYAGAGVTEGLAWFDAAHQVISEAPPALRVRALQNGAWMLSDVGAAARATTLFEESLAVAQEANHSLGRFEGWIGLGYIALDAGDLDTAHERMETAISFAKRARRGGSAAEGMVGLALVARMRGDVAAAGKWLDQAMVLAESATDPWAKAAALTHKGELQRGTGDAALATATFTDAIDEADAAGDHQLVTWASIGLFRTQTLLGQIAEARSLLLDISRRVRHRNDPLDEQFILDGAAEWFAGTGHMSNAVEAYAAAERARMGRPWQDPPDYLSSRRRLLQAARASLGPVRFQAAWTAGEARGLAEAIDVMIPVIEALNPARLPAPRQSAVRRFGLTNREQEVLALVVAGMSDGEIAETLVISKKTVSVHVANVKGKLAARNRVEIATMASRLGLARSESPHQIDGLTNQEMRRHLRNRQMRRPGP